MAPLSNDDYIKAFDVIYELSHINIDQINLTRLNSGTVPPGHLVLRWCLVLRFMASLSYRGIKHVHTHACSCLAAVTS